MMETRTIMTDAVISAAWKQVGTARESPRSAFRYVETGELSGLKYAMMGTIFPETAVIIACQNQDACAMDRIAIRFVVMGRGIIRRNVMMETMWMEMVAIRVVGLNLVGVAMVET